MSEFSVRDLQRAIEELSPTHEERWIITDEQTAQAILEVRDKLSKDTDT